MPTWPMIEDLERENQKLHHQIKKLQEIIRILWDEDDPNHGWVPDFVEEVREALKC